MKKGNFKNRLPQKPKDSFLVLADRLKGLFTFGCIFMVDNPSTAASFSFQKALLKLVKVRHFLKKVTSSKILHICISIKLFPKYSAPTSTKGTNELLFLFLNRDCFNKSRTIACEPHLNVDQNCRHLLVAQLEF